MDQAREYYYGPHGGKPIRLKDLAEFADSLAAELQKENARLREALRLAKRYLLMNKPIHATHEITTALNPPKGGAVQKGLSKEKAK